MNSIQSYLQFRSAASSIYPNVIDNICDAFKKCNIDLKTVYSSKQIQDICQNKNGSWSVNKLRVFEILGYNVQPFLKEHDWGKIWKKTITESIGTDNLGRFYSYFLKLYNSFDIDKLQNGEVSCEDFEKWYKTVKKNMQQNDVFAVSLKALRVHYSIIEWFNQYICSLERIDFFRARYRDDKKTNECERIPTFEEVQTFLNEFDSLNVQPNDLSFEKKVDFCRNATCLYRLVKNRILFLKYLECNDIDALMNEYTQRETRYPEYVVFLKEALGDKKRDLWPDFEQILSCFGENLNDLANMDDVEIFENFQNCNNRSLAYRLIRFVLHDKKLNVKLFHTLDKRISYKYKHKTIAEDADLSTFTKQFIEKAVESIKQRIEHTSAHPEKLIKKHTYHLTKDIIWMQDYILNHLSSCSEPLKWFLENCTYDIVKTMLHSYASQQTARNSRVKNVYNEHHAKKAVSRFLSFLKHEVSPHVECGKELKSLTPSEILALIPNQRVPADPNKRRTYTDEEIQSMYNAVANDPVMDLCLTILVEIGLRSNAICYLTYGQIVDEFHKPRHTCSVPEKGNKLRTFSTSPNLKQKIVTFIHHMSAEDMPNNNWYVFSTSKLKDKPLPAGTLSTRLKRIATSAGITDVVVHPHAFRHTIVGKLVDVGNSMDVVSKYIGHSNVDTTQKFYYVKTFDEITKELKNPFTDMVTPEQKEEYEKERIDKYKQRLDCAIEIIDKIKSILYESVEKELTVLQALELIDKNLPNVDKILRKMADSSVETSTVITSNTANRLPTIEEEDDFSAQLKEINDLYS